MLDSFTGNTPIFGSKGVVELVDTEFNARL